MIEKLDFKNMDNKTKIEVVATALMILIFLIILISSIKTIVGGRTPAKQDYISPTAFQELIKRDASMATTTGRGEEELDEEINIPKEDKIPWGRDPFSEKAPTVGSGWAISDLRLEGILLRHGSEPRAVINGEIVGKGDKIGSVTVVSIENNAVIVSDGEKNYELQLW